MSNWFITDEGVLEITNGDGERHFKVAGDHSQFSFTIDWYEGKYGQTKVESPTCYSSGRDLLRLQEYLLNGADLYVITRSGCFQKIFLDGKEAKLWLEILLRECPEELEHGWSIEIVRLSVDACEARKE